MADERTAERSTEFSPEGYRVLFEHIQDGVFVIRDAVIIFVNDLLSELVGYTSDELIGRHFQTVIVPQDRAMVLDRYRRRLAGEDIAQSYELRLLHKNGHDHCHVLLSVGVVREGAAAGTSIGTVKDITAMRRAIDALECAQREYQTLRERIADVFYRTGSDGVIADISVACLPALGYRPKEMIGRPLADFYANPADRERVVRAIKENDGHTTQVEAALRHRDGHVVWISTNAYLRRDLTGQPIGIEGIARDISERKAMEDELRTLSTHDDLTGAFNRRYFMTEVERELERARRYGSMLSLLIFDIDLFKDVNDNYGHPTGDRVLQQLCELCQGILRKSDVFARMGGEEFAALLPETDRHSAAQLCERLRQQVAATAFCANDEAPDIHITISLGATIYLPDDHDFSQLYSRADSALYQAKHGGRNRLVFLATSPA